MKRLLAVFVLAIFSVSFMNHASGEMKITLPEGAIAFDFGNTKNPVPGFKGVDKNTKYEGDAEFGFTDPAGLNSRTAPWPDALTGSYILINDKGEKVFKAKVPNGDYLVWLSAGQRMHTGIKNFQLLLKLNDIVLIDEKLSHEEYFSENYFYRFLSTQYSERPHALWLDYINRMYPGSTHELKITSGELNLTCVNHFLSALILVPVGKKAEFKSMTESIQESRIQEFESVTKLPEQKKPVRKEGDSDTLIYYPNSWRNIQPDSAPTEKERKKDALTVKGAIGQRIVMRVAVVPFKDQGKSSLVLSELKGTGVIPVKNITGYFENYRIDFKRKFLTEMTLLPGLTLNVEKGITQCFWLWLKIPDDAKPGTYQGKFSFKPEKGSAQNIPVKLEVYPFKLDGPLPLALGMYYGGRHTPHFPEHVKYDKIKEQFVWMRELGFTGSGLGTARLKSMGNGDITVHYPSGYMVEIAKEVGMGAHPEQMSMVSQLPMARMIGRKLMGNNRVDKQPGVELKESEFRDYYMKAMKQYKAFLDSKNLPYAMESVDEPRERKINPWNRNMADTNTYSDLIRSLGGIKTFVTPMRDKDRYTPTLFLPLVDHHDIVSIHGWKQSERLFKATIEKGKTLWLYNTGKDRFSWGFFNWHLGSKGRYEWHWSYFTGEQRKEYPNREWYNPFTSFYAFAQSAPYQKHRGGITFRSVFFDMSEGINDSAYLFTLTELIKKAKAAGKHAETVKEAEGFLANIKKVIPPWPKVKGLASAADQAKVGMGIDDEAMTQVDIWREKIAGFIVKLKL